MAKLRWTMPPGTHVTNVDGVVTGESTNRDQKGEIV
jgi:hypothetical protein